MSIESQQELNRLAEVRIKEINKALDALNVVYDLFDDELVHNLDLVQDTLKKKLQQFKDGLKYGF